MKIEFKTQRVQDEYLLLSRKNPALYSLLTALSIFCEYEIGKPLTLTHIFRTPEEHAELYKDTPESLRPKTSPHMFWRAVDIRSSVFSSIEITRMLEFLNRFRYVEGRPVAIYHSIAGNVSHFHIQYGGHKTT